MHSYIQLAIATYCYDQLLQLANSTKIYYKYLFTTFVITLCSDTSLPNSTKMQQVCESIVGVPVTAPKWYSDRIEIRYTEVSLTIDKAEKDSNLDSWIASRTTCQHHNRKSVCMCISYRHAYNKYLNNYSNTVTIKKCVLQFCCHDRCLSC